MSRSTTSRYDAVIFGLVAVLHASCASEDYIRIYHTEALAPSLSWDDIATMDHMGATLVDRGVNFTVYSERADRLELLLFDDPESDLPTFQVPMENQGAFWNIYVEGVGHGLHYGYIAWGPNWEYDESYYPGSTIGFKADVDGQGNRFNPNKLLTDPYSFAYHRDHDWSKASLGTGPMRHELTYGASMKTVVVDSDYEWSAHEEEWLDARESGDHPGHGPADLILYEVHPKGFTKNPASGVDHPGTFRGMGENAAYLQDLGITGVELLPIHEKPLDGGYWGYNNLSFFAPELEYSADYAATGEAFEIIDEFKWMVDQLHQHDIEVIVDVVYNHTGEGGLWREKLYFESYDDATEVNFDPKEVASLYSMRGLDNASWYALSSDGQTYWNNTGVGNQTRPNHIPMERLIMDSLHYMVQELHVDGFRFDLAGILGEPDGNYNDYVDPAETILQTIIDDPILRAANTRIIAEPWTAGGTGPGIGGFPTSSDDTAVAWGEWNPYFRDWWRDFMADDEWKLSSADPWDGGAVMTGTEGTYGWNDRKPYHTVNFITVHDGFTLYDLTSYEEKQNGCGLLNPICCDDPTSAWCDEDSGESHNRSRNWVDEDLKRQIMRNFFAAMLVSHGTPLLLGGDEWMRTQFGNNNAYSTWADNAWNWYRWGEWQSSYNWDRYRMHDFVRQLIQFRKDHAYALAPTEFGDARDTMPFSWKNASGNDMDGDDWSNRHVGIHYYDDGTFDEPEIFVLINQEEGDVAFTLPSGRSWRVVVDTQAWFDMPATATQKGEGGWFDDNPSLDPYLSANIDLDDGVVLDENAYTAVGRSFVILVEDQ